MKEFKNSYKPFGEAASRFKESVKEMTPGLVLLLDFSFKLKLIEKNFRPGSYEFDVERNRSVQMLHSFGGRVKLIPAVDIRCTVENTDIVKE